MCLILLLLFCCCLILGFVVVVVVACRYPLTGGGVGVDGDCDVMFQLLC